MKRWKVHRPLTGYLDATLQRGRMLTIPSGTILEEMIDLNDMVRVTWPGATESAWVYLSEIGANAGLI